METKPVTWSDSTLHSFETCPKRHYLTKVVKRVPDPPGEQMHWGRTVHKALEKRAKGEAALPPYLANMEATVATILKRHGKRVIEAEWAVDRNYNPCAWMAPTVWCRSKVDIGIVGATSAFLGDWKTGNRKFDSTQMQLMAAQAFSHFPYLEKVATSFIWIKDKLLDNDVFTRQHVQSIWDSFLPRVTRLEIAFREDKWPAQPSGLCGKWCPVTKKDCPYGK